MGVRCPGATALGTAPLKGWRFVITVDAVGSIVPHAGSRVQGVLWRLTPRDLAAINAYEGLDSGLYLRRILPVRHGARRVRALVYIARWRGQGVGFRAWIESAALARGLEGWVRNRRDGSVEAVFVGQAKTVAAMVEA